jgi:hypothetical protein
MFADCAEKNQTRPRLERSVFKAPETSKVALKVSRSTVGKTFCCRFRRKTQNWLRPVDGFQDVIALMFVCVGLVGACRSKKWPLLDENGV